MAMFQFLQENVSEIILLVFLAIWWLGVGFFSIKGDINSFDKKRIAKGMMPMTDDEKLLLKQTHRSSLLNNLIQVIIAGIVALIVISF
jgi:hypothetical protein